MPALALSKHSNVLSVSSTLPGCMTQFALQSIHQQSRHLWQASWAIVITTKNAGNFTESASIVISSVAVHLAIERTWPTLSDRLKPVCGRHLNICKVSLFQNSVDICKTIRHHFYIIDSYQLISWWIPTEQFSSPQVHNRKQPVLYCCASKASLTVATLMPFKPRKMILSAGDMLVLRIDFPSKTAASRTTRGTYRKFHRPASHDTSQSYICLAIHPLVMTKLLTRSSPSSVTSFSPAAALPAQRSGHLKRIQIKGMYRLTK